jgi:hypothetical protein
MVQSSRLEAIIDLFRDEGVEFIIIGGQLRRSSAARG